MSTADRDTEQIYQERLGRYVAAMRLGTPDKVPIRPFAAEFTARHAGYSCQQVTHDYEQAFEAVIKTCADYDWDAAVPSMIWVWTGLTEAIGLNYYGVPGIHVEPDMGFQYREPPEEKAFMQPEEYDEFIADPTRFAYETWLPRAARHVAAKGEPNSYRSNLSFVKGAMAMSRYFGAAGAQVARMRSEVGVPSAISGMLKAPLDVLADKFRGYIGLVMDLQTMPEKVMAACEALQSQLLHVALSGLDPEGQIPIPIWMHRTSVPFISYEHFDKIHWPTLKPMVEEIWRHGNQTLFYAEGKWDGHLERFKELPKGSVIFHLDQTDPRKAQDVLGGHFAMSGGVPNYLLSIGTPDQVKAKCKEMIDLLGQDGGYIMDSSAIIQNDATPENMKAMTDFTREYGVYSSPSSAGVNVAPLRGEPVAGLVKPQVPAGVCIPFTECEKELPEIQGDRGIVKRVWEECDEAAHMYIWQVVLSF
jgi:methoxylated aromatic compound---corrinoid protein Co-methyltransferase